LFKLLISGDSDSPLTLDITSVALSSDGRYVSAVPRGQRIVRVWDTTTGAVVETLVCRVDPVAAFSPGGAKWLSRENLSDELARGEELEEMTKNCQKRTIVLEDACELGGRDWSPDADYIFYADRNGSVNAWSADGVPQFTLVTDHGIFGSLKHSHS
jgi:WD40 repeat protein